MMKAGKILSIGLLSAFVFGCDQATEPATRSQVDGHKVGAAVNALTKSAAVQAGYGISRATADDGVNPFDTSIVSALQQIGVCDNFIQLMNEIITAGPNGQSLMEQPRFMKVVTCFEAEAKNLAVTDTSAEISPDIIFPIFDKCFCDGSGSVFGAIRAYAFSKYSAPTFTGYSAPSAARGYSAPAVAPGYGTPAAAPGYSAPGL
jgi:hypothetical protein